MADKQQQYGQISRAKPHHSVGFWDDRLKSVRTHLLGKWITTICILMAFASSILSLYWGFSYVVPEKLNSLTVHVVDFDGSQPPYVKVNPIVGPVMTHLTERLNWKETSEQLTYHVVGPEQYDYDPIAVRRAVYDFKIWAAIVINPNATTALIDAITSGNASYDPTGAVQYTVMSARQERTYNKYIRPQLQTITSNFMTQFGKNWTETILSNNSYAPAVMARAPAAVNPGVVPLEIDLRPFGPSTATPAVSIGRVYLIVVAFLSCSFFMPLHANFLNHQDHPPLHFHHLTIYRWSTVVISYLFISLVSSLVSLCFGVRFTNPPASSTEVAFNATAYGHYSFPIYWAVNFAGLCALGLACENAAMILGQRWAAMWLVFWVLMNDATSLYSLELAPEFFRWGYALPLHHVVEASRHVLFDLKSNLALNFGVLVAWVVVGTALFPVCSYVLLRRVGRERKARDLIRDKWIVSAMDNDLDITKKVGEAPRR
ncbi:MNNG and nitrosoguanidine resistance protein [Xylariaceae sp. FL1019]|nr:MNNG and nitrosoguanidine resistance protein [Xylariaceae sp. FL1019]